MIWVASNFTTTVSNDAIDQRSCAMMFLQKYSRSSKQLENLQLSSQGRCLNFYPSNNYPLKRDFPEEIDSILVAKKF